MRENPCACSNSVRISAPRGASLSPDRGPASTTRMPATGKRSPATCCALQHGIGRWSEAETARSPYCIGIGGGDPSRIRTCNPRSRNPLLYPVELWDRPGGTRPGYPPCIGFPYLALSSTANMKNPLPRQDGRTDFLNFATKADGGPLPVVRP